MSVINTDAYSFQDITATLSAAQSGDEVNISLMNDIVFSSALSLNTGITLNLSNGGGVAQARLSVAAGGSFRHFISGGGGSLSGLLMHVGNGVIFDGGDTGGGIQIFGSACTLTLDGCTVMNCRNSANGGGVLIQGNLSRNRLILNNARIENCQAGSGGAIFGSDAELEVSGSQISGNRAGNSGGGITTIAGGNRMGSTLTVRGGVVSSNSTVANDGGGINAFDTIVTIEGAQITNNIADNYGGGIRMLVQHLTPQANSLIIRDSVIRGNRIRNTGGGIGVEGQLGEFTIINSLISENEAASTTVAGTNQGGGIYYAGGSTLTLIDTTVRGNFAGRSGGGVFANLSNLIARGSTEISSNEAGLTAGGIYGFQGCNILIEEQARVINNHAYCNNDPQSTTNGGGGIALLSFGFVTTLTVRGEAIISGNTAVSYGGGIWTYPVFGPQANIINIEGGILSGNSANYGGAVSLGEIAGYTPVLNVTGGSITGNNAATDGGAIIAKGSLVSLANCQITDNVAGRDGGAIFTDELANVTVYASAVFSGNQAGSYAYWAVTSGGDSDIHLAHIFTQRFSTFIPQQTPPPQIWVFLNAYNNYDINYTQPLQVVRVNFTYAAPAAAPLVHTTGIDSFLGATVIIPARQAFTDISGEVWVLEPPNQPAQTLVLTDPDADYEVDFSFTPAPEPAPPVPPRPCSCKPRPCSGDAPRSWPEAICRPYYRQR